MSLSRRSILFASLAAALGIIGVWNDALISIPAWKFAFALLVVGLIYEWIAVNRNWPGVRAVDGLVLKLGEKSRLGLAFSNTRPRRIQVDYVAALPLGLVGSRETKELSVSAASEVVDEVSVPSSSAAWVLPHRLVLTPEAELDGTRASDEVERILAAVPVNL